MNNSRLVVRCLSSLKLNAFHRLTGCSSASTTSQLLQRAYHNKSNEDQNEDREVTLNPFTKVGKNLEEFLNDLNPPLKKSFNLAAYVNSSKTLQELVKLGVSLYDIENTNYKAAQRLVTLDFEKDCAPYIRFLVDKGLKNRNLGRFISEYPNIFQVSIENLQTRLDFLKSVGFTDQQLAKALNRSSAIISHNVESLDYKMGLLKIEFHLSPDALRRIVTKFPLAIAQPVEQYKLIAFTLDKEFGFTPNQVQRLLEEQPRMLDMERINLIERLDLVHNIIGFSHSTITKFPKLVTGPRFDIKHRAEYLKKLKRDQYDPSKPLFVPPTALYNESDEKFCSKYAKTDLDDYKLFLKSC